MPDPILAADGSPLREEFPKERPFNHPMSAYDDESQDSETGEQRIDPRAAMIEAVADRNNEERQAADGTVLHGLVPEYPKGFDPSQNTIITPIGQGVDKSELPEQYASDPLAEFIVMQGDKPMFKTVYQGQERLIPLENAHREIQKHVAADIRLQQNTEWQRQLEAREAELQRQSAALAQSLQTMHTKSPPSTARADVDDADLAAEAREVVSGLFSGTEDEAAAKLANLLKKNRGPSNVGQPVDVQKIVAEAARATRHQLSEEAKAKDVNSGYKKFQADYPEILADPNLFRYADGMTDSIAAEHPDWQPSEVMLEAGKRVREWVTSMKAPAQPEPNNDRLERKQQLRPLPRTRLGTQDTEPEEQPETAADIMAQIRAQRGQ